MIEFGLLCLMLAGAIGVVTVSGALAARIARRADEDENVDRLCPCGKTHTTLSEELAAHGDPPS